MPNDLQLTLTAQEAEIVIDALEADLDDYLEDAKDARGENNTRDALAFEEAAERIQALLSSILGLLPEPATGSRSQG